MENEMDLNLTFSRRFENDYEKVVILVNSLYEDIMRTFSGPKVEIIVNQDLRMDTIKDFIESKMDKMPPNTVWVSVVGCFSASEISTCRFCEAGFCSQLLESLVPHPDIDGEESLFKIIEKVCNSCQSVIEEVRSIIKEDSVFFIIPPYPVIIYSEDDIPHHMLHKLYSADFPSFTAEKNYLSLLKNLLNKLGNEMLDICIHSSSKYEKCHDVFVEYKKSISRKHTEIICAYSDLQQSSFKVWKAAVEKFLECIFFKMATCCTNVISDPCSTSTEIFVRNGKGKTSICIEESKAVTKVVSLDSDLQLEKNAFKNNRAMETSSNEKVSLVKCEAKHTKEVASKLWKIIQNVSENVNQTEESTIPYKSEIIKKVLPDTKNQSIISDPCIASQKTSVRNKNEIKKIKEMQHMNTIAIKSSSLTKEDDGKAITIISLDSGLQLEKQASKKQTTENSSKENIKLVKCEEKQTKEVASKLLEIIENVSKSITQTDKIAEPQKSSEISKNILLDNNSQLDDNTTQSTSSNIINQPKIINQPNVLNPLLENKVKKIKKTNILKRTYRSHTMSFTSAAETKKNLLAISTFKETSEKIPENSISSSGVDDMSTCTKGKESEKMYDLPKLFNSLYEQVVFIAFPEGPLNITPNICKYDCLLSWDLSIFLNEVLFNKKMSELNQSIKAKKTLLVIVADIRIAGSEYLDPMCTELKCQNPLSIIKCISSLSISSRSEINQEKVRHIITLKSRLEAQFSDKSKVIIAPLCPKLCLEKPPILDLQSHNVLHKIFRLCPDAGLCILEGQKYIWEKVLMEFKIKFEDQMETSLNSIDSDIKQVVQHYLEDVVPVYEWRDAAFAIPNFNPAIAFKYRPLMNKLISIAVPSVAAELGIYCNEPYPATPQCGFHDGRFPSYGSFSDNRPPLTPRHGRRQSSLKPLRKYARPPSYMVKKKHLPLESPIRTCNSSQVKKRPRKSKFPEVDVKGIYKASNLDGSIESNSYSSYISLSEEEPSEEDEMQECIDSIISLKNSLTRMDEKAFENVFVVGKEFLIHCLEKKNAEATLIYHDLVSFAVSDIPLLLGKFGAIIPGVTVCILAFDFSSFTTFEKSKTCQKFGCHEPILAATLIPREDKPAKTPELIMNAKLDEIKEFVAQISKYLNIVLLPLYPSKLVCDNASLRSYHLDDHESSKKASYLVVAGSNEELTTRLEHLMPLWQCFHVKINQNKKKASTLIEKYTSSVFSRLTVINSKEPCDDKNYSFITWKKFLQCLVQVLKETVKTTENESDESSSVLKKGGLKSDCLNVKVWNLSKVIPSAFLPEFFKAVDPNVHIENVEDSFLLKFEIGRNAYSIVNQLNNFYIGDTVIKACIVGREDEKFEVAPSAKKRVHSIFNSVFNSKYMRKIIENVRETYFTFFKDAKVTLYKIKPCKSSCKNESDKEKCPFYHNEFDQRRNPATQYYSGEMCHWLRPESGQCQSGPSCKSSHNRFEQEFHPEKVQVEVCHARMKHRCANQPFCPYAHRKTSEMFFLPSWEDVLVFGTSQMLEFLAGATRALAKVSFKSTRICLMSISADFLKMVNKALERVLNIMNISSVILEDQFVDPNLYQLFLGTPRNFAKLKQSLLSNKVPGAFIVNGISEILDLPQQKQYFMQTCKKFSFDKHGPSSINKVFVSSQFDKSIASKLSSLIGVKVVVVEKEDTKSEDKYESHNRHSSKVIDYKSKNEEKPSKKICQKSIRSRSVSSPHLHRSRFNNEDRYDDRKHQRRPISTLHESKLPLSPSPYSNRQRESSESRYYDRVYQRSPVNTCLEWVRFRSPSPYFHRQREDNESRYDDRMYQRSPIDTRHESIRSHSPSTYSHPGREPEGRYDDSMYQSSELWNRYIEYAQDKLTPYKSRHKSRSLSPYRHKRKRRQEMSPPPHGVKRNMWGIHEYMDEFYKEPLRSPPSPHRMLSRDIQEISLSCQPESSSQKQDGINTSRYCRDSSEEVDDASYIDSSRIQELMDKDAYQEFLEAEQWMQKVLDDEYLAYQYVPDLHPDFKFHMEQFSTHYVSTSGKSCNEDEKKILWERYWVKVLKKLQTKSYNLKRNDLINKCVDKRSQPDHQAVEKGSTILTNVTHDSLTHGSQLGMEHEYNFPCYSSLSDSSVPTTSEAYISGNCTVTPSVPVSNSTAVVSVEQFARNKSSFGGQSSRIDLPDTNISTATQPNIPSINAPSVSTLVFTNSQASISASSNPTEIAFSVEKTLTVIESLSDKLGVIGPAVCAMINQARELGTSTPKAIGIFADEDNVYLMNVVLEKLRSLESSCSNTLEPVMKQSVDWIEQLLEHAKNPVKENTIHFDLEKLAKATLGKHHGYILDLIEAAANYKGLNLSRTEMNDMYIKICSIHFDLQMGEN